MSLKNIKYFATLYLLFISFTALADIIPDNSHMCNRSTRISNIDDFPDYVFVGIIEGPMARGDEKYIVKNNEKLRKGYKFNRVDIYAVKKVYYEQKGGLHHINFKSDKNSVKINDGVLKVGSGYISNDKPISNEFYYYSIEKLENVYLNIYLSKKITVYTDGKEDLVQNFESDFKIDKIKNEDSIKEVNENELLPNYNFNPDLLDKAFSSSFEYKIWKIKLMIYNGVKLSKKVLLKWAVKKHKDKIICDLVNKDTITTYSVTFYEGQPDFEETLEFKLADEIGQEEISHALSYAIKTSNIDLIKNLIGYAEFNLDNHLLNAFKIQNKTGENREEAIEKEFERIYPFLEAGADLTYVDEDNKNVLDYCIHEYPGNFDIVLEKLKFLKERNFFFDPEKKIFNKLFKAVITSPSSKGLNIKSSVKLLDFLFSNVFTIEHKRCKEAVFTAISKAGAHTEIIEALLKHGADINSQSYPKKYTPLIFAIQLLEKYKDSARITNVLNVTSFLLQSGADVSLRSNSTTTPLHYAAKNGVIDIVKLLIEGGADINVLNDPGYTPLHYAAKNGFIDIVKLLIENGADVNLQRRNCTTALHYAAKSGNADLVHLLLTKGAKIDQKDGFNAAPMYYSKSIQIFELLKLDNFDLNHMTDMRYTFFQEALLNSPIDFICYLLDLDSSENKNTSFSLSRKNLIISKLMKIVNKLNTYEINEQDSKIRTPLHFSVPPNNDINLIIKIFLMAGADIDLKTDEKSSALDITLNTFKFSTTLKEPCDETEEKIRQLLGEWENDPEKTRHKLLKEHHFLKTITNSSNG
ncbi:MAG: ankyrin repeat domain-containing protein [Candidatus Delongbacteria bacterium]|nr:ankyrin repeat domain-containing protein [Candidatus Delongbacteria bacterium]